MTAMPGTPRRLLTLDTVWWLLPPCLAAMWALLMPVDPADFWHHAALGRWIAQERALPTVDTFSFTQAGQPYYYQAWLGGLLLYFALAAGGVQLVILLHAAVLVASTTLLLRWTASRCRHLPLAAALVCASIPLVANNWNVRPQTFAIPVLLAFAWTLDVHRRTRTAPLWLLPPLMALWVNLHGTFALGLLMLAIAMLAEGLRPPGRGRALGWFSLTALATLANPHGVAIFGYLRGLLTHSTVKERIVEWQPLTSEPVFAAFVAAYALLLAGALLSARRRPPPADLLLAAVLAVIGWSSLRSVMWFVWLTIPMLADALATGRAAFERAPAAGRPAVNAALALVLLGGVAACSPFVKPRLPLDDRMRPLIALETPVEAVEALAAAPDPPRRLFHPMEYGSYLMWAEPRVPVFADPRIELYPPALWSEYLDILAGRDALRRLDDLHIDALLLSRREQAELIRAVEASGGWTLRHEDERAVYLRRS
jgi:hypothetical protein